MNKLKLKKLVDLGLSQTEIALKSNKSQSTVRYWLNKHGLKTKNTKRISVIWSVSRSRFVNIVKKSNSFADILRYFNLENKGNNYKTLKRRLHKQKIDYSHIPLGYKTNLGRNFNRTKIPLKDVMVEKSTYSRNHLKKRIIEEKLIEYKCAKCRNTGKWKGQKLVLVLDHINGIPDDHRLSNLRFLCPNCNSQTNTFTGKNRK